MSDTNYYHAGAVDAETDRARWSDHTRRSFEAARNEARRLARKYGGRPVVEHWDRSHGLRPGDQEVVSGADFVD